MDQVITEYIGLENSLFFKTKLDYNHMFLFYVCTLDWACKSNLLCPSALSIFFLCDNETFWS